MVRGCHVSECFFGKHQKVRLKKSERAAAAKIDGGKSKGSPVI